MSGALDTSGIVNFNLFNFSGGNFQLENSVRVAGSLGANQFQTRTDTVAQDADDRFILRTTDRTLWFDANGNGAGGLTMLADLQAGAVVTAADIYVF